MIDIIRYIETTLGEHLYARKLGKEKAQKLPLAITGMYELYEGELYRHQLTIVRPIQQSELSVHQMEKQLHRIWSALGTINILVLDEISAYTKKKLIDNKINFIVPGKQLFLPELLVSLQQIGGQAVKKRTEKLLPSAQVILLHHFLDGSEHWELAGTPFKDIAHKLSYTPMGITKAIENLNQHQLVIVEGEKEKHVSFKKQGAALWHEVNNRDLFADPVLKRIYTDQLPENLPLYRSNETALSEYSDMNPSRTTYYAIGRNYFYHSTDFGHIQQLETKDTNYCIEVWKYDPGPLAELWTPQPIVDPLSLYLSMRHLGDERVEMALESILENILRRQPW